MTRATTFLLISIALAVPAGAQEPSRQDATAIVTTGLGVVKLAPDRVWVSIAAESRARNPRDAQRVNAEAMTAVVQKLKAAGLPADAIRTASYDLQPEFDYANGKQTLRGYVARNALEVRVDEVTKLGEILDAVVGSGATTISGVRFDVKNRVEAEREALKLAVADARARADAAAMGAGVRIDRVVRIEEQRAMMPEPRPMAMMRQAAESVQVQTPIAPGEIEVRATVTLTASIR